MNKFFADKLIFVFYFYANLDGRSKLKEDEVSALRDKAPIEGLAPISSADAVVLVMLDVRVSLGGRVLVRSEQGHLAELLIFQFLYKKINLKQYRTFL